MKGDVLCENVEEKRKEESGGRMGIQTLPGVAAALGWCNFHGYGVYVRKSRGVVAEGVGFSPCACHLNATNPTAINPGIPNWHGICV